MLSKVLRSSAKKVAGRRSMAYLHDTGRLPDFTRSPHLAGGPEPAPVDRLTDRSKKDAWTSEETHEALKDNCVFAWGASDPLRAACPVATKGDGVYIHLEDGKKIIDFSSGAVCSNLGNTVPQEVKDAVNKSMDEMGFVYGDLYVTEVRARLCALLADIVPGDINGFLFASSGSEANEAAIRMARAYTGRHKVLSRQRSYHGGTTTALAATGDPRTWASMAAPGIVKMPDPFPFTFDWGDDDATRTHRALSALHEQILTEGPDQIACMLLESITGANGWMITSTEYMQGVRALCDKYGILLIMDEVMTGFGRTGKLFGFEHFDGVLPDMITFAKGTTSAYIPLSGVGCRDHVFDHFRKNPIGYGSTYSGHPLCMAVGEAVLKYTIEKDILGNVNKMAPIFAAEIDKLVAKHPSIKAGRSIGLAGGVDLAGKDGNFLMDMHGTHPGLPHIKNKLKDLGLITLFRGHHMHITPPLTINEAEIKEGFAILDEGYTAQDAFIQNA